jgi:hypothetical protein
VSENPLNSTESIKLHKQSLKDHETPVVKSLFDFAENKQYKKEPIPQASKDEVKKPLFAFNNKLESQQ